MSIKYCPECASQNLKHTAKWSIVSCSDCGLSHEIIPVSEPKKDDAPLPQAWPLDCGGTR
jgi:transcription elongation factor Elf1